MHTPLSLVCFNRRRPVTTPGKELLEQLPYHQVKKEEVYYSTTRTVSGRTVQYSRGGNKHTQSTSCSSSSQCYKLLYIDIIVVL